MIRPLSKLLVPLSKPKKLPTSVDLLLDHGFIHQTGSGIYDLKPLGFRIQKNIEKIVRQNMDKEGFDELALATQVNPQLWRQSGRLGESPNPEFTFTAEFKHLLNPTGEEQMTSLVGSPSYRQLPLAFYQITRKFRNELRPKGGLMRTREFVMKDLYSFDDSKENAHKTYFKVSRAYHAIFKQLGVPYISVTANPGDMGGDMSEEFHYLSESGEDNILECTSNECDFKDKVENLGHITECPSCHGKVEERNGIEIGHIFYLGTRYSEPMKTSVALASGEQGALHMGSYGIGVTRLIGAIAEKCQDKFGLKWPASIAPYQVCVVGKDPAIAESLAAKLGESGFTCVYEDRTPQLGHAMRAAREAGWPVMVIAGRDYENGFVEVQIRETGESQSVSLDSLPEFINSKL